MADRVDPKEYGLPARTTLERDQKGVVCLIIDRKSRVIMADGGKILKKVKKILLKEPDTKVCLKTSAPVCSRTQRFLEDQGIVIKPLSQE